MTIEYGGETSTEDVHTVRQRENYLLDLMMDMVRFSKQKKKKEYRAVRKEIMSLYHGKDEHAKKFIKETVKSFRLVANLNVGE